MGKTSQNITYPTYDDIVKINYYHIKNSGGFHDDGKNLLNPGSLEWVLDTIQHPLFEIERHKTIAEKAAMLSWTIITRHVFNDGNKRTGASLLLIFLRANGYKLDTTNDEIIDIMKKISTHDKVNITYDQYLEWIRSKIILITPDNS